MAIHSVHRHSIIDSNKILSHTHTHTHSRRTPIPGTRHSGVLTKGGGQNMYCGDGIPGSGGHFPV